MNADSDFIHYFLDLFLKFVIYAEKKEFIKLYTHYRLGIKIIYKIASYFIRYKISVYQPFYATAHLNEYITVHAEFFKGIHLDIMK